METIGMQGDCESLRQQVEDLRAERAEFLWKLGWAEQFIGAHMRESSEARKIYGEIDVLLRKSEEGLYILGTINDPRNQTLRAA